MLDLFRQLQFQSGEQSALSYFRSLLFISHWLCLQNATARNAVENPVVNQAALRAGKSFHQKISRFQRGRHCCQRVNNNTGKTGRNWPIGVELNAYRRFSDAYDRLSDAYSRLFYACDRFSHA